MVTGPHPGRLAGEHDAERLQARVLGFDAADLESGEGNALGEQRRGWRAAESGKGVRVQGHMSRYRR